MTPSEKIVAKLTPKEQKPVLDPEIKAWVDFVKKYHFAVVKQYNPQGDRWQRL